MMHFAKKSEKGFTLFTALIAFILIILALLLVQSMVSTERNVSDIISDIEQQDEMQAIADLTRADALQVFNFGVRYSIEEYSKRDTTPDCKPDVPYLVFADDATDWDNLENEFVRDRFGIGDPQANQFATLAAGHLISLLSRSDDARGYSVDVAGARGTRGPDQALLSQLLKKNFEDQGDFFDVISCNPDSADPFHDCVGSFYVTMDLSVDAMDNLTYEKFPQIQVQNRQTGRVLKEPILPRGKFRIYVPTRLFKALMGAREIGYTNDYSSPGFFENGFSAAIPAIVSKSDAEAIMKAQVDALVAAEGLTTDPGGENGGLVLTNDYETVAITEKDAAGDERLVAMELRLYFKETNEKYRVSSQAGKDNCYGITLKKFA